MPKGIPFLRHTCLLKLGNLPSEMESTLKGMSALTTRANLFPLEQILFRREAKDNFDKLVSSP